MNWLRVLGTAELPHIDQGVRHPFHAKMSLLNMFKTQEEPLELIFPGKGPIDLRPQRLDGGIEQPLSPALQVLSMARIRFDVWDHASIEETLTRVRGINASVEIQRGSSEVQTDRFGHSLQGFQSFWQQDHIRLMDGSHWAWRDDRAMVVGHGDTLLALLMCVARGANAIPPFWAMVLVPSPWRTRRSSGFSSER
jgi:hypothetical protein